MLTPKLDVLVDVVRTTNAFTQTLSIIVE